MLICFNCQAALLGNPNRPSHSASAAAASSEAHSLTVLGMPRSCPFSRCLPHHETSVERNIDPPRRPYSCGRHQGRSVATHQESSRPPRCIRGRTGRVVPHVSLATYTKPRPVVCKAAPPLPTPPQQPSYMMVLIRRCRTAGLEDWREQSHQADAQRTRNPASVTGQCFAANSLRVEEVSSPVSYEKRG